MKIINKLIYINILYRVVYINNINIQIERMKQRGQAEEQRANTGEHPEQSTNREWGESIVLYINIYNKHINSYYYTTVLYL